MSNIKQDQLGLNWSTSFPIEGIQEANVNLNLTPVKSVTSTVYGKVTDGTNPIPDATVKLFDSKGMPFKHTLTDENGEYSIDSIPVGSYSVGTVKNGYRLSNAVGVTLSEGDSTEINLTCTPDVSLALGAIAGVLTIANVEGSREPLAGAKVTLMNSGGVVAVTYTVADGEFTFYDVEDGKYTVISTADGYMPVSPMSVTITNGSIANIMMSMAVDTRTHNGTVSGVICDSEGHAVAGCFVGLYKLEKSESEAVTEKLIATTKTNSTGNYLFGNVSSGNYIVKAKMNK